MMMYSVAIPIVLVDDSKNESLQINMNQISVE